MTETDGLERNEKITKVWGKSGAVPPSWWVKHWESEDDLYETGCSCGLWNCKTCRPKEEKSP